MKKHVKIEYDIVSCNGDCPNFYFNFEDMDNVWCSKLNRRISDCDTGFRWHDHETREIPKDCPLTDA